MLRGIQRRRGGGAFLWLLVGLLIGGAAGAGTVFLLKREKVGIPGSPRLGQAEELALVPADAFAFIHIRARDVWKSEFLNDFRNMVEKAEPDAPAILGEEITSLLSTMDRATLVVFANSTKAPIQTQPKAPAPQPLPQPKTPPKAPGIPNKNPVMKNTSESKELIEFPDKIESVWLLTFTTAYDANKVREALVPDATSKDFGGKTYWEDQSRSLAAFFPSNTILVVGSIPGVHQFVIRQTVDGKQAEGPLTGALHLAAPGGRQVVAAINARQFHFNLPQMKDHFNPTELTESELLQLASDAESLLHTEAYAIGVAMMGSDDLKVDIHAYFKDDKDAVAGEKSVRAFAELAHKKVSESKKKLLDEVAKKSTDKTKPRHLDDLPRELASLVAIGGIKKADDFFSNPPIDRKGKDLIVTVEMPSLAATVIGSTVTVFGMVYRSLSNLATPPNP
jgi:hypothetical protein